ncbi:uncharacterized protein LOC126978558 [Leptidea sinapis]|uniref:uncharacterized protein LOC126978558 n=1 Tax=Leptidea sinapis TaxID=189913 RepID=UPI0021C3032A|nr:uncharacterized protein LOC126978558 [Leptidea sinapis]
MRVERRLKKRRSQGVTLPTPSSPSLIKYCINPRKIDDAFLERRQYQKKSALFSHRPYAGLGWPRPGYSERRSPVNEASSSSAVLKPILTLTEDSEPCIRKMVTTDDVRVFAFNVEQLEGAPVLHKKRQIKGAGIWYFVTANLEVDFIEYDVSFHCHHPDRNSGRVTFRTLQVQLKEENPEIKNVINSLHSPIDIAQTLLLYTASCRQREDIIMKLQERFSALDVYKRAEGGFLLTCAEDTMRIVWTVNYCKYPRPRFMNVFSLKTNLINKPLLTDIATDTMREISNNWHPQEITYILGKVLYTCLEAVNESNPESRSPFEDTRPAYLAWLLEEPIIKPITSCRYLKHDLRSNRRIRKPCHICS